MLDDFSSINPSIIMPPKKSKTIITLPETKVSEDTSLKEVKNPLLDTSLDVISSDEKSDDTAVEETPVSHKVAVNPLVTLRLLLLYSRVVDESLVRVMDRQPSDFQDKFDEALQLVIEVEQLNNRRLKERTTLDVIQNAVALEQLSRAEGLLNQLVMQVGEISCKQAQAMVKKSRGPITENNFTALQVATGTFPILQAYGEVMTLVSQRSFKEKSGLDLEKDLIPYCHFLNVLTVLLDTRIRTHLIRLSLESDLEGQTEFKYFNAKNLLTETIANSFQQGDFFDDYIGEILEAVTTAAKDVLPLIYLTYDALKRQCNGLYLVGKGFIHPSAFDFFFGDVEIQVSIIQKQEEASDETSI